MLFASRWLFILLSLLSTSAASPVNESLKVDFAVKSDKSWLWGWAWGSESTVSVVDRSPVVTFYSRPAAFGAEINDPILGYIIPISSFTKPCVTNETITNEPDNSGCPSLCLSGEKKPADAWIALVQRGGCEFVKKVREAQRFGAKAVVVGGENPEKTGYSDSLVNMYSPEDSSDVKIAATYIRYIDYMQLYALIATSNTSYSGLRTLSLLITAEYSVWEWYSPIITFVVILLLPSILTFVTLLIHRIRAARAAQRDRAPENVVHGLPWRVWTGNGWEKHEGNEDAHTAPDQPSTAEVDLEEGILPDVPLDHDGANNTSGENPSTSHPNKTTSDQPWFETQQECAICLSDFVRGDKVRVLPCHHIFHLHEVDEWLIHRKKLCPVCKADVTVPPQQPQPQQPQNPQANQRDDETQHLTLQIRPANPTETTPLLGN